MTMTEIGVSKFKEQCLALLARLPPEGVIVTKRGKPIAVVTPYPQQCSSMIGRLSDKITIHGDIMSTGVAWDADA